MCPESCKYIGVHTFPSGSNAKGRIRYKLQFAFVLLVMLLGASLCISTLKISQVFFCFVFVFLQQHNISWPSPVYGYFWHWGAPRPLARRDRAAVNLLVCVSFSTRTWMCWLESYQVAKRRPFLSSRNSSSVWWSLSFAA